MPGTGERKSSKRFAKRHSNSTLLRRFSLRIEVSPSKITADRIDQRVHFVPANEKRSLLLDLLRDEALKRVIVFTRTKHGANKTAQFLENTGHFADVIQI